MKLQLFALAALLLGGATAMAEENPPPPPVRTGGISGTYKSILEHQGSKYYQHAVITLRTIQSGDDMKVGGSIRVLFGEETSQEYLTYDFGYGEVDYQPLQGGIFSMKNEKQEVSVKGRLDSKKGIISGTWASNILGGNVGPMIAKKAEAPTAPADGILVRSLGGHYKGKITISPDAHPDAQGLPTDTVLSLVTLQELTPDGPSLKVSGTTRLYWSFDEDEFLPYKFEKVEYNPYTRVLQTQTAKDGITFKGVVGNDGVFKGTVETTAWGPIGTVEVKR